MNLLGRIEVILLYSQYVAKGYWRRTFEIFFKIENWKNKKMVLYLDNFENTFISSNIPLKIWSQIVMEIML